MLFIPSGGRERIIQQPHPMTGKLQNYIFVVVGLTYICCCWVNVHSVFHINSALMVIGVTAMYNRKSKYADTKLGQKITCILTISQLCTFLLSLILNIKI